MSKKRSNFISRTFQRFLREDRQLITIYGLFDKEPRDPIGKQERSSNDSQPLDGIRGRVRYIYRGQVGYPKYISPNLKRRILPLRNPLN